MTNFGIWKKTIKNNNNNKKKKFLKRLGKGIALFLTI